MPQALPPAFVQALRQQLGETEADALCAAIAESVSPVSLRLNLAKRPDRLPAEVSGDVPWCETGCYLAERPCFTADPLLHAGCYYVQEASSMFVEQAWRRLSADGEPRRVLDLCAAPGGKSTLWRSLMPDGALLVANEPIRQRAQILAENLTKWGHPDTVVTQAYPADFAALGSYFDVIAADVPCSGEGMFRKEPDAVAQWSPDNVAMCAARQWEIISDVWSALREGGWLVYSTCTYNRYENEDNVVRICEELGAEPVPLATAEQLAAWGISGDTTGRGLPVCHFFPHKTRGEGFFLALLRKTASAPTAREKRKKRDSRGKGAVRGAASVAHWLSDGSAFRLFKPDEAHICAVRESLADDVQRVCATVRALTAGISLAEERGRKLIPQHALALSQYLAPQAFPRIELSLDQAFAYLRREVLTLADETPRGYVIVAWQGHPLGFANNLGTRANNLYPAEWRIRTALDS